MFYQAFKLTQIFCMVSDWFKTVWNGFLWKCSPRDILPVFLAWVYFLKWFHFLTCDLHLFSPFYFLFWIGQINQSCHCQIWGFYQFEVFIIFRPTVKEVTVSIANDNRDMMILILILITTISMNLDTVIKRVQVLISSWYEAMTDSNDVIWHDDDNDNDDDDDGNLVRRKGGTKDLTTRCWKTEHQPMTLIIIVIIIMIMMMIIDDHHNCDDDDDVVTSGRAWSHPCYPKYEIWAKICCMMGGLMTMVLHLSCLQKRSSTLPSQLGQGPAAWGLTQGLWWCLHYADAQPVR